jgi:hypothetical protein
MLTLLLLAPETFAAEPAFHVPVAVEIRAWGPPPPPPPRRPPPPPPRRPVRLYRPAPPPPPVHVVARRDPSYDTSVTIAWHDTGVPMVGGTVELKMSPHASFAIDGGVGSAYGLGLYDIGAQARFYGVGDFDRGLFLAAALGATDASPADLGVTSGRIGAWAGGKVAFRPGLTLEAAVGLQAYANDEDVALGAAANIGLGWSF